IPKAAPGEQRFLLRVRRLRVLLALGFASRSAKALEELRGTAVTKGTAELERRYLGLVLRFDPRRVPEFLRRYEEFVSWVEPRYEAKSVAFYRLELLLLTQVFADAKPRYPESLVARGRSLANQAGGHD